MKKWYGNRGRILVDGGGGGGLLIYRTIVLFGYVRPCTNYVTVRMYASLYARTPHSVSESGKVPRAGPAVPPTLPLPCGRRQLPEVKRAHAYSSALTDVQARPGLPFVRRRTKQERVPAVLQSTAIDSG